jgi:hypothetical protein
MRRGMMALLGMTVASGVAGAEPGALTGEALRKAVAGKTVVLDTPIGIALPISYRGDGTMSGRAGELANYVGAARDSGTWWISRDRICQKWSTWLEGKTTCFSVTQQGSSITWQTDAGTSGTGTIAAR